MFKAILLFIQKMALKRKLKKEKLKSEKNALAASADGKDTKEVKKIKRKLFKINILLLFTLLQPFLVMLIVSAFGIHIFLMMGTVSGNRSIFNKDDPEASESMPGEWDFDIYDPEDLWGNYGINPDGTINISGGLYPKDPTLKRVAQLLETLDKAASEANTRYGTNILSANMVLEILIKETAAKSWNSVINDKSADMFKDLMYENPICNQKNCSYMKNGISHFNGGTVVNGADQGDPKTQSINADISTYNRLTDKSAGYRGDHAVTYGQFEIKHFENRLIAVYPIGDYASKQYNNSTDRYNMDSQLGFIRPNAAYIPDIMASIAEFATYSYGRSDLQTALKEMQSESWYTSLSDDDKLFCSEGLTSVAYGGTDINAMRTTKLLLKAIAGLQKDGSIKSMREFAKYAEKYGITTTASLNSSNKTIVHHSNSAATSIVNAFLNDNSLGTNASKGVSELKSLLSSLGYSQFKGSNSFIDHVPNPVYTLSQASCIISELRAEVAAAEKETPIGGTTPAVGQYIEYVGSGKFKPVSTGEYYNQATQMTIFRQTTYKSPYNGYWSSKYISQQRMADAGCGVYSLSFALTNLTGTLISPSDVLNKGNLTSLPISHSKIQSIAKAYGLESYTLPAPKTEEEFMEKVVPILQKGGVLIGVFVGNFEWYTGGSNGAHYMTIRGYIEGTNKFLIYSSVGSQACGWNEAGMEKLMNTPLTPSQIIPHFNSEKKFTVVIPASGV